jgi:hypothetical protein
MLSDTRYAFCAVFLQVPALGWRKRDVNGNLGAYSWLTYSQVGSDQGVIMLIRPTSKHSRAAVVKLRPCQPSACRGGNM